MAAPLSGKILVADDNDLFRAMLAESLAGHGCEVLQATNGLEALLYVKHESPRAVIIDATMPRLGGFEASGRRGGRRRRTASPKKNENVAHSCVSGKTRPARVLFRPKPPDADGGRHRGRA
jgi:PleD family two-component response regulator